MDKFRQAALALGGVLLAAFLAACGGSRDADQSVHSTSAAAAATSPLPTQVPAASSPPGPGAIGEHIQPADAPREVSGFKTRGTEGHPTSHQIGLGVLSKESEMQKPGVRQPDGRMKTATLRSVPETATTSMTSNVLAWTPTPEGGRVAALRFSAEGARGLRLGVLVEGLPLGSVLRFSADRSDQVYEVTAQQIFQIIQRNRDAGDDSDAARTFWSPNLGGAAVTLEIVVPPGAPANGVQISVPKLAHVVSDLEKTGVQRAGSGSCQKDIACSSEFLPLSPSVALMDFIDGDSGYTCTGTLMNDRAADGVPYFLTAAHCISSQTAASTLYTHWNVRSKSCGSTLLFAGNGAQDLLTGGATLLYTSNTTDTTLLRLRDAPPPGAVFAASYSTLPGNRDAVATVHHPQGDSQKISVGTFLGTYTATDGNNFTASPIAPDAANANFLGVTWNSGTMESGSSGAPLFLRLNGMQYVVGQLRGGNSSCANPFGQDFFGRFDKAYAGGMATWLAPYSSANRAPIYRFYNTRTRSHFYTIDAAERDLVISRFGEWSYEGTSFYAYGAQHSGTQAVHRFYSTQTGSHFFTMSESEKQHIISSFPWWKYEGVAWYANTSTTDNATPLYRFYNAQQGTHFFTASATERDYIIGHYSEWAYEGIGYQVWMNP